MPKTPTQTVTQELVTQPEGTGKSFSLAGTEGEAPTLWAPDAKS